MALKYAVVTHSHAMGQHQLGSAYSYSSLALLVPFAPQFSNMSISSIDNERFLKINGDDWWHLDKLRFAGVVISSVLKPHAHSLA